MFFWFVSVCIFSMFSLSDIEVVLFYVQEVAGTCFYWFELFSVANYRMEDLFISKEIHLVRWINVKNINKTTFVSMNAIYVWILFSRV